MRDALNVNALKYSKSKKDRKIYEKAIRILEQGIGVEELSEEEVLDIASRYPQLSVSVAIGGNIFVKSKKDSWFIRDEGKFLSLYHRNITFKHGRVRDGYHIQDIFCDLDFVFASIVSHDDFSMGIKSRNMRDIHELIGEIYTQTM